MVLVSRIDPSSGRVAGIVARDHDATLQFDAGTAPKHAFTMSAQEIIAELPKLKPEELRLVKAKVDDLARAKRRTIGEALLEVAGTAEGLPTAPAFSRCWAGEAARSPLITRSITPITRRAAETMSVAVFADTFHFLALLNSSDAAHVRALQASCVAHGREFVVTTEFVLLELADALAPPTGPCGIFVRCSRRNHRRREVSTVVPAIAPSCSPAAYSSTVSGQTRNGRSPIASPSS